MYENVTRYTETLLLCYVWECYKTYENAATLLYTRCMRSTSWKIFGTVRFLQRSQKPTTFWPEICLHNMIAEALRSLHWQFDPWKLNSAFILTYNTLTSDGSTYPSYNSTNSFAPQDTAVCGTYGWVVVNDAKSVINDRNTMMTWMKGC